MTRGFVELQLIDDLVMQPDGAGLRRGDRSADEVQSCR